MNYFTNRETIIKNNDGNHVNGEPESTGYEFNEPMDKCPVCGKEAPAMDIKSTGECNDCIDKFWEDYKYGKGIK